MDIILNSRSIRSLVNAITPPTPWSIMLDSIGQVTGKSKREILCKNHNNKRTVSMALFELTTSTLHLVDSIRKSTDSVPKSKGLLFTSNMSLTQKERMSSRRTQFPN